MVLQKLATKAVLTACVLLSLGCSETARIPIADTQGPNPKIPPPNEKLLPTVKIAPAVGWPEGITPEIPASLQDDLQVALFAADLDHPRWLHVLPNGDVLVAESNAPAKPDSKGGLKKWIQGLVMKRAGAGGKSADRISILRDTDGDGRVDVKATFLDNLHSPFGMALVGSTLYVANTDAVMAFPYQAGDLRISSPGETLVSLPAGSINYHWTKGLIANAEGDTLYVSVGSNSNVAEKGLSVEEGRAAIWEIDVRSKSKNLYASGLRNPVGMAWEPNTNTLYAVVNERDELGSDLVPDYLTSIKRDGFYGWPYSYYGDYVDERVKPQRPELVATAIVPDYALGNHVAPLGLAYSANNQLPALESPGMFIGLHGSWNRKPLSGYKLIFVPFKNGRPSAMPVDILRGFVNEDEQAYGRPVGVAVDATGAILVADDVGNRVWRVSNK